MTLRSDMLVAVTPNVISTTKHIATRSHNLLRMVGNGLACFP